MYHEHVASRRSQRRKKKRKKKQTEKNCRTPRALLLCLSLSRFLSRTRRRGEQKQLTTTPNARRNRESESDDETIKRLVTSTTMRAREAEKTHLTHLLSFINTRFCPIVLLTCTHFPSEALLVYLL